MRGPRAPRGDLHNSDAPYPLGAAKMELAPPPESGILQGPKPAALGFLEGSGLTGLLQPNHPTFCATVGAIFLDFANGFSDVNPSGRENTFFLTKSHGGRGGI